MINRFQVNTLRSIALLVVAISISACGVTGPQKQQVELKPYTRTILGDASLPGHLYPNLAQQKDQEVTVADAPHKIEDIWDRIRGGFEFGDYEHPRIQRELNWFARHPEYMNRVAERAMPYMYYIVDTLEKNDIPLELALLPIVESAFKPFAYSHGRASGIWQFIPATGRRYGLVQNWWYDGRRDVYASTQSAVRLLLNLKRDFKGDWLLALAAYNTGSGNVRKAIRRGKRGNKAIDFWSLKLPKETRAYAPKLLALKKIISNPEAYGLKLKPIPNKPYFERVDVGSQIDLAVAAEMADMELDQIYGLNPGYNRWATSPTGPNYLLLPLDKVAQFKQRLSEVPAHDRIRWVRHKIRSGESLISIADKYNLSPKTVKRVNRIRGNRIRVGRYLTIPVASRNPRTYKLSANQRKQQLQNTHRRGVKVKHIVQHGDTFWSLARAHRVGVRQLARWNGMAPRDPLSMGQKLIIWSRAGLSSTRADPNTVAAPPKRKLTTRIGYKVRRGDSLARISRKFQVSINQLRRWNRSSLRNGNLLRPGQRLTLFVDVMRTSGG